MVRNKKPVHWVLIHGINTYDPIYSLKMIKRLGINPNRVTSVYWTDVVSDDLLNSSLTSDLDRHRNVSIFHPIRKFRFYVFREIWNLLMWIRSYEDLEVRKRILDRCTSKLRKAVPEGCRVNIIGHSLGSVIVTDLLNEIKESKMDIEIGAIFTMGSPLHHWKPRRVLLSYLSNIPSFCRWYNLYDPDDLIAGGLSNIHTGIEDVKVSTGYWTFSAHTGYWRSRSVAKFIRNADYGEE